jgi:transposase
MIIIRVDYHPEFQQIALLDKDTGEFQEKRLSHHGEAEKFYRALRAAGEKVRIGMEASGHARWFERLRAELQLELWIGDAAAIQSKRGRKQKTDRQDAEHILKLMLKDNFPRIWVPNGENRDLRQLLWHRDRMVQARTRIMNQLQAVAINEGYAVRKNYGEPDGNSWHRSGREFLSETITMRALSWTGTFFTESEMALFPECMPKFARKRLDTADIVRDA